MRQYTFQIAFSPHHLTLLDTPGHKDFSEDTYRTLFAVDGVVMVIDAAKGIETQTRKLFEVCKLRRLPVLTFINKLDLPSRDPFDLLDEIEKTLALAIPPGWEKPGEVLGAASLRRRDLQTKLFEALARFRRAE